MPSRCGTVALLLLLAGGCSMERTSLTNTAVQKHPGADETLDFWDTLETQSVTTNNDALHALILVNDGDEGVKSTWPQRLERARTLGWIAPNAPPPAPAESATVGLMAVAGCHILDTQGGLSMAIWGRSSRYSTRELVHISVLPGIGEHEALSGAEFIAFIDALEQRQRIDAAWKRKLSADADRQEPFTGQAADPDDGAAQAPDEAPPEPPAQTPQAEPGPDEAQQEGDA